MNWQITKIADPYGQGLRYWAAIHHGNSTSVAEFRSRKEALAWIKSKERTARPSLQEPSRTDGERQ